MGAFSHAYEIGAFGLCEASNGQAWSPNPKERPTFFLAQNNPSNLTAKILSMIFFIFFNEKKRWPLDYRLGFHSRPTQTSFESLSPSSKSNHFTLPRPFGRWPQCKGSIKILFSWFLPNWLVEIDGLTTFGHNVKHPLRPSSLMLFQLN